MIANPENEPAPSPAFELGRCIITRGALLTLGGDPERPGTAESRAAHEAVCCLIDRHHAGDWGDLDADDKQANDDAIADGGRILSAYHLDGVKFYVITEGTDDDGRRPYTTVLRADEY